MQASQKKEGFEAKLTQYRQENRNARPYDIAKALGVSEQEILVRSENLRLTQIRADWKAVFAAFASWGRCMALSRNDAVVSEVKGVYGAASFHGPMGLVHADAIDLRMFTSTWAAAYAVEQQKDETLLRSVQIFDKYGRAVHKTYPQELSEQDWAAFQAELGIPLEAVGERENAKATERRIPDDFQLGDFRHDWSQLQDTHDFFALLKKHGIDRLSALETVGKPYAETIATESFPELLRRAKHAEMPIMIFVGNPGMIQIFSGAIQNTKELGAWYNVLDPDFNLHANMHKLKRAFIVRKPTRYGLISSLELFDEEDELAVSVFGYRKDEKAPSEDWQKLLDGLREPL